MANPKVEVLPIENGATQDLSNVNRHTRRGNARQSRLDWKITNLLGSHMIQILIY